MIFRYAARAGMSPAPLLFLEIDPLPQLLAGLEVRNVFGRYLHLLTGFRIASGAWRAVIQAEAPEAPDLDALTFGEAFRHRVQDHLHGEFSVFRDELWIARRELRNQLRLGHGAPSILVIVGCWL